MEKLAESPDIVAYTMAKRMAVPFHVDSLFIWENEPRLKLKNAMCYEGNISYPDSANPSDPPLVHRLVILHGVEGKFGIQVIEDSTDSVYATVRPEFRALLWSLSIDAAGSPESAEESALRAICSDPASQRRGLLGGGWTACTSKTGSPSGFLLLWNPENRSRVAHRRLCRLPASRIGSHRGRLTSKGVCASYPLHLIELLASGDLAKILDGLGQPLFQTQFEETFSMSPMRNLLREVARYTAPGRRRIMQFRPEKPEERADAIQALHDQLLFLRQLNRWVPTFHARLVTDTRS